MANYPEREALTEITNYWGLEEYIFGVIGPAIRETGSYTFSQFATVSYWKSPRPLAHYRKNEEPVETVSTITGRAFASGLPDGKKPRELTELAGVRVAVASALLTVWRPERFTIIDRWALKTLSLLGETIDGVRFDEHGQSWWEKHYDMYLQACLDIAESVKPYSLRQVDRALWKWGQINAPG